MKKIRPRRDSIFSTLCMLGLLANGCGSGDGDGDLPDATAPIGGCLELVMNTMELPQGPGGGDRLGLDLDGNGTPDNKLAGWTNVLANVVANPELEINEAIAAGRFIQLHRVHADDFTNDTAALWQVYEGDDTAPALPDFGGDGIFTVAASSPADDILRGGIESGVFLGGPSTLTLRLPFNSVEFILPLIGARIDSEVTATNVVTSARGRMGGALPGAAVATQLMPGIIELLDAKCATDCQGLICSNADTDQSCTISVDEFNNNAVLATILELDLDLLDANGQFNPNSDGVNDSLSIGIGFTATGATFNAPCPANE